MLSIWWQTGKAFRRELFFKVLSKWCSNLLTYTCMDTSSSTSRLTIKCETHARAQHDKLDWLVRLDLSIEICSERTVGLVDRQLFSGNERNDCRVGYGTDRQWRRQGLIRCARARMGPDSSAPGIYWLCGFVTSMPCSGVLTPYALPSEWIILLVLADWRIRPALSKNMHATTWTFHSKAYNTHALLNRYRWLDVPALTLSPSCGYN
jgi:hypothetical protein